MRKEPGSPDAANHRDTHMHSTNAAIATSEDHLARNYRPIGIRAVAAAKGVSRQAASRAGAPAMWQACMDQAESPRQMMAEITARLANPD